MAAYAALLSVSHIIDQLQHHPRPPISLHKQQVESFTQNATFLQEFLETYNFHNSFLEIRIADAAHAAEDIIESHIVDQILNEEKITVVDLYEGLQKVIEDMYSIKKEVMDLIKQKTRSQHHMQRNSIPLGSSKSSSTKQNSTIMGIDDVSYKLMDKLTGGPLHRQIIPIVGMGGIGKTTLARNIYRNQTVVEHFDILAWATISQEYRMTEILSKLCQVGGENSSDEMKECELGEMLHKRLSGRRYLIVVDDIWETKMWDHLHIYLPNNNNGSRIVLTTRLSNLAKEVSDSHVIELGFLDKYNSWSLFCKIVFGSEDCPVLELEKIGRIIVERCRGLPLSINVIGGLLAMSAQTKQYWEYIAENLNSVVNLEDNEHVLKTLYTSYNSLPVYLKPCFLYMGVFEEDSEIRVSRLMKLWMAEGFLKPIGGKSLEDVAEECLEELVARNLILVEKRNYCGKLKLCYIHDLLRDLCLSEARKQKFLNIAQDLNISERRICFYKSRFWGTLPGAVLDALRSSSVARSLILNCSLYHSTIFGYRLLRVYAAEIFHLQDYFLQQFVEDIFGRVNLRYIDVQISSPNFPFQLPSSISLLWNLQSIIVNFHGPAVPFEIWKMPQLSHVEIKSYLELPSPPTDDVIILENLQTLLIVRNFNCGEEVVERIPNIMKLRLEYSEDNDDTLQEYCLNNIGRLHKLSSFSLTNYASGLSNLEMWNLSFPHSLKKLSLYGTRLGWEEMTEMVGSLPLLQVLGLRSIACMGPEWHTTEGQFVSLKFLEISGSSDLEYWETESSHFPRLEHLDLGGLPKLKEIPLDVAEILTLELIDLKYCNDSNVISAKRIVEEQENLFGEVALHVRVELWDCNEALESLASPNFGVECTEYVRYK